MVLEGIPGMYYPEIGKAIGTQSKEVSMNKLAESTPDAMLIPDFVAHSHQTIPGLYPMLCADFSKQSWDTPKAFELQQDPARAPGRACRRRARRADAGAAPRPVRARAARCPVCRRP